MIKKVRVRFAPSPTGPLHIGGVRTALFNYLFAKKNHGDFILRIEDTDQNRWVEGAEDYIIEALRWCGIDYDEGPDCGGPFGPYRQSERQHLYQEYALELVNRGKAYYAFDTQESLDFHRSDHASRGKTFMYNWHNRLKLDNSLSLPDIRIAENLANGSPYVIRFKVQENEIINLKDTIRGSITIDSNVLDDKVIFKSDGMPTYHLANIVDDHLMEISHVIRGEEWLPSLALHQLLYEAFDWEAPQFAHLPLIMKPEGKGKLSKRDGEKLGFPVFPLSWYEAVGYREAGYFPDAVVNFLALLGWNPGTEQEIFSLKELTDAFSLDRVHKAGARFDPDKTKWYNQHYLQQQSDDGLAGLFLPLLRDKLTITGAITAEPSELLDPDYILKVVRLIKARATFVSEFWELGHFFFLGPDTYAANPVKRHWKSETPALLAQWAEILASMDIFTETSLENRLQDWTLTSGLNSGTILPALRLVLVGDMKGPGVFEIMAVIGKSASLQRIGAALAALT